MSVGAAAPDATIASRRPSLENVRPPTISAGSRGPGGGFQGAEVKERQLASPCHVPYKSCQCPLFVDLESGQLGIISCGSYLDWSRLTFLIEVYDSEGTRAIATKSTSQAKQSTRETPSKAAK